MENDPVRPRAGLLPLYLALYDRAVPENRALMLQNAEAVRKALEAAGLDVACADICTVRREFDAALSAFEKQGVDLLVTLHLAYSPSGESAERLARSPLPILMLDTTLQYDFGPGTDPAEIMGNHGIHGVQDLASVLRRMGKRFAIEAGHLGHSDVVRRAARWAQAAAALRRFQTARVGRIGKEFAGMHDFAVTEETLKAKLGPVVERVSPSDIAGGVLQADSAEVRRELALDRERFDVSGVEPSAHTDAVRAGLALRRFVEERGLTAVTMNFESFTADCGMPTVPFLEAGKLMARGIGYAGENDVLTAALVGALCAAYGRTTFTEMFCPDWKGGSVFLSHMGEINVGLAARKPLLVANPYPWAKITPPVIAACTLKPGPAAFANIVPGPHGAFGLILAPVEVLPEPAESRYTEKIRAWIKPRCSLETFLQEYSRHGGTHHAALVMGDRTPDLEKLAFLAGLECVRIGE
jgi:L-arabinose isomerase